VEKITTSHPNFGVTSTIFQKLPLENICSIGENSANHVKLLVKQKI
jgi:hypothetical protein